MKSLYRIFCGLLAFPGLYLLLVAFSDLAPGVFVVRFGLAVLLCLPALVEFGFSRASTRVQASRVSANGISSGQAAIGFVVVGLLIVISPFAQHNEMFVFGVFGSFALLYSLKELIFDTTSLGDIVLASVTPLWLIAFFFFAGFGPKSVVFGGFGGLALYFILIARAYDRIQGRGPRK